jgi:hypothetical protein
MDGAARDSAQSNPFLSTNDAKRRMCRKARRRPGGSRHDGDDRKEVPSPVRVWSVPIGTLIFLGRRWDLEPEPAERRAVQPFPYGWTRSVTEPCPELWRGRGAGMAPRAIARSPPPPSKTFSLSRLCIQEGAQSDEQNACSAIREQQYI